MRLLGHPMPPYKTNDLVPIKVTMPRLHGMIHENTKMRVKLEAESEMLGKDVNKSCDKLP